MNDSFRLALEHTESAYNIVEAVLAEHRDQVIRQGNDPDHDPEHQHLVEATAPLRRWLINGNELAERECRGCPSTP